MTTALKNAEVARRRTDAISRGVGVQTEIYVDRAVNSEVWDIEGNRYIDFAAGIAVVNTGHCHPKVMAAVTEQMSRFTHTCHQVLPYENYVRLAERLNSVVPGDFPKKTVFVTTGAEAVENAIKVARIATNRNAIIAFGGAFHGRTMMGMSLTGKVDPYKKGFGAMMPDVYHVPFPQDVHGISSDDAMAGITKLFKADLDPGRVAAIIFEPVQGEGAFSQKRGHLGCLGRGSSRPYTTEPMCQNCAFASVKRTFPQEANRAPGACSRPLLRRGSSLPLAGSKRNTSPRPSGRRWVPVSTRERWGPASPQ
jgi:4-aminobutyrate aminotransferase-like enzyme